jgi:hypothetical protein
MREYGKTLNDFATCVATSPRTQTTLRQLLLYFYAAKLLKFPTRMSGFGRHLDARPIQLDAAFLNCARKTTRASEGYMKLRARQKYDYGDLERGEAQLMRVGHALWRDRRKLGDTVSEREGINAALESV